MTDFIQQYEKKKSRFLNKKKNYKIFEKKNKKSTFLIFEKT